VIEEEVGTLREQIRLKEGEKVKRDIQKRIQAIIDCLDSLL
jgi:hypothetical protein